MEQLGDIITPYSWRGDLASSAISTRDYLLDIFKQYGVSDTVNIRMSSGLYEVITMGLL